MKKPTNRSGCAATAIATAFSSCVPATATTTVGSRTAPTGTVSDYIVFSGALTGTQTNTTPGTYTGVIKLFATAN